MGLCHVEAIVWRAEPGDLLHVWVGKTCEKSKASKVLAWFHGNTICMCIHMESYGYDIHISINAHIYNIIYRYISIMYIYIYIYTCYHENMMGLHGIIKHGGPACANIQFALHERRRGNHMFDIRKLGTHWWHHISITGWWFGIFLFSHILGMSSSQLTFIFFRGVGIPTTNQVTFFLWFI